MLFVYLFMYSFYFVLRKISANKVRLFTLSSLKWFLLQKNGITSITKSPRNFQVDLIITFYVAILFP